MSTSVRPLGIGETWSLRGRTRKVVAQGGRRRIGDQVVLARVVDERLVAVGARRQDELELLDDAGAVAADRLHAERELGRDFRNLVAVDDADEHVLLTGREFAESV